MATTLEQDAAALFQRALKENHLGLVSALKLTVPAGALADALKGEIVPDQAISPAWQDALTRPTYDLLDARKMVSPELMSNPNYALFISRLFKSTKDRDSQHALLHGLTAAGHHTHALNAFNHLEKPDEFVSYFKNYLATVTAQYSSYYFTETGTTKGLTPTSLDWLDKLDLDIPADFTEQKYPKADSIGYEIWNESRFQMNIERVGAVLHELNLQVPAAKRHGSGPVVISHSALANAYIAEYARIDAGLGSWHQQNFPSYLPVLADASSLQELEARGGVRIKPNQIHEFKTDTGAAGVNPSHGFSPVKTGEYIDPKDILLAMSLLSLQQVADLIKTNNQQIVLVPAEQLQALVIEPAELPEALRVAVRYHRPELLVTEISNVQGNCLRTLPTGLYLKGFEIKPGQYKTMLAFSGLGDNPAYPSCFVSDGEIAAICSTYALKKHPTDTEKLLIVEKEHLTVAENVTNAHAVLQSIADKIGYTPAVSFRGSPAFMRALATSKIPTTEPGGMTDIKGNNQDWYSSSEGKRVGACLGSVGYEYDLLKLSIPELLTKGCRMKDSASEDVKTAKQRILGLLDRYSLEDLVANMKTEAQFKFVNENFDLMPLVQKLPKKFSLIVAGENFTKDLGL